MRKIFILDTNVLVHDPMSIFKFEDNDVMIPIYVLEEIDRFKRESTERGRNARECVRQLDSVRALGSLAQGVALERDGFVQVYVPEKKLNLAVSLQPGSGDNAILQSAIEIRDAHPERRTIFITMDVNLRIRADALNLQTEVYEHQSIEPELLQTGVIDLTLPTNELESFFHDGAVVIPADQHLSPNVCATIHDENDLNRTALARFHEQGRLLKKLITPRDGVLNIRPRNREQSFALDLLLDDSVQLVTLVGSAGTGKTLLALAAGLSRVAEEGAYSKLVVSRPIIPMGRDLGYLPGSMQEKMDPWMKPVFDNLEFLLVGSGKRRGIPHFEELIESGTLQVEPLTYIRARSLPQQFVIIDEAQNLTPHEAKTIITRCGEGTKIVFTGDPNQIDNPYVDASTNGLMYIADKLHDEALVGHIVLHKGERSALANLAVKRL